MADKDIVKFADNITLCIGNRIQIIGAKTELGVIAIMAVEAQLASRDGIEKHQIGDQIEWEVTLRGRTTIDQRMRDNAVESLLR